MSSLIVWVWMGNFYRMLYPGTLSYAYLNNSLSFVSKASSNNSTRLSFLRSWPDRCLFSTSIKISNTVIGPFCQLIAGTFGVLVCNMFVLPHFVLLNFLNHFQNILLLFVVVPVHCSASSLLIQDVIFVFVWNLLNILVIHVNWYFFSETAERRKWMPLHRDL